MRERPDKPVVTNPFAVKQPSLSMPKPILGQNPLLVSNQPPLDCKTIEKMYKTTLSENTYKKGIMANCPGFRGGKKSRNYKKSMNSRKSRNYKKTRKSRKSRKSRKY